MKKKNFGQRLRNLFSRGTDTETFFEDLEDILIEADLGGQFTMELTDRLRGSGRFRTREDLMAALKEMILSEVNGTDLALDPELLNVVLVLGVNGVGKTTNLAKLAHHFRQRWPQAGMVLAAGDTFRAAAVEQIATHAERLGVRLVRQGTGSDPGAVIYDAVTSARSRGDRIVLADTAGRMHNRANLVKELEKIHGIIRKQAGDDVIYRKLLVLDATTGQNALRQAEMFHEAVGVDAVLLAKYDSSARGGILVPLARQLGLSCAWVGTGETYADLEPFDPTTYVDSLLDM
ncbi:MAG: signal recognition particle-docking protein FtsY [Spirochaeta sp.]|jgi:fused signal recognition particle receptor|nr:signal recognition particle-docking protein FtsY [Spirochaeta sp.]